MTAPVAADVHAYLRHRANIDIWRRSVGSYLYRTRHHSHHRRDRDGVNYRLIGKDVVEEAAAQPTLCARRYGWYKGRKWRHRQGQTQNLLDALMDDSNPPFTLEQWWVLRNLYKEVLSQYSNPHNPFEPHAFALDAIYEFGIQPAPSNEERRAKVTRLFIKLRREQWDWLFKLDGPGKRIMQMRDPRDAPAWRAQLVQSIKARNNAPILDLATFNQDEITLSDEEEDAPENAPDDQSAAAPLQASGASAGQGQQINDVEDEKEEKDEKIDGSDWHTHDDDDGQWSDHEYDAFPRKSSFDK